MSTQTEARYVPAAGRRGLTALYDPVIAVTMREKLFRTALADQVVAALPAGGGTVVDVGAGTGTFAVALAQDQPSTRVIGVDGDPEVLARAAAKDPAGRIDWRQGLAGELPVETGGADAVVMSLLLHHLTPADKRVALREAHRVLRQGGSLHIADWGRPQDPLMRATFFVLQLIDGFEGTAPHVRGELPDYVVAAGFAHVSTTRRLRTGWGTLELLRAQL